MHSYILTGIRTGPFVRLLREHGITLSPKNLVRFLFIFQNCLWASFFAWRERKAFKEEIKGFPVPDDPVIIIGHWRTGSTFLHLLLAQDEQFIAPSLFQVTIPEGFLVSDRYYRPVLGAVLTHRPMDNVALGFDDPQEDEFALLKLTGESPLHTVIFPEEPGYFIRNPEDFNPAIKTKANWQEQFRTFCKKVVKNSGKKLLLKNPFHSLRIPLLLETFPNARFIHIHRHPYKVAASSLNLWKVMAKDNQLKGKPYFPSLEEVVDGMDLFYREIEKGLAKLPMDRYCEVAYEDLEKDPVEEIRKVYARLGFNFSEDIEYRITAYLDRTRQFKKNSYTFGGSDKKIVFERLKKHFQRYQYPE
jgi:hypothetical protein